MSLWRRYRVIHDRECWTLEAVSAQHAVEIMRMRRNEGLTGARVERA